MWLRLKYEGMQVTMIDSSTITGWKIDVDELGDYALTAMTPDYGLQFHCGTSDECHTMLNDILSNLNYPIIDVNTPLVDTE